MGIACGKAAPEGQAAGNEAATGRAAAKGRQAPLAASARVVSLSPAVTQTIYALGAGDRIAGCSRHCTVPDEVVQARASGRIATVGDLFNPGLEHIIALRPDLVIAERTAHSGPLSGLPAAGLTLELLDNQTLDHLYALVRRLGELFDRQAMAKELLARLDAALLPPSLAGASRSQPPRVLVAYHTGQVASVTAAGTASYQSEMLQRLGAVNVLAGGAAASRATVELPAERLLQLNPDIIIVIAPGPVPDFLEAWRKLPQLAAVREGRVLLLAGPEMMLNGACALDLAVALRTIVAQWHGVDAAPGGSAPVGE